MTNVVAYRGHQNPVWDVEWSPMGVYFATGSRDRTARLWSTDRTSCLRVYAGHLSDVDVSNLTPGIIHDLNFLFASVLNSIRILFILRQVPATGRRDYGMSSEDHAYACSSDIKGLSLHLQSARMENILLQPVCPSVYRLYRDTDCILGEDLAINLWDLGSGRRIKKMTGHAASIYSLAFSEESSLLVSGGADWTVRCWDVKSAGGKPHENGSMSNGDSAIPKYSGGDNET